ncbi:unnamed protein product [Effrenium voratum]|nr:unnamed protein product [Effrenium voratum]
MPKTAAAKGSKGPAGQDYWFVFDSLLVALMIAETWVLPGLLLLSGAERGNGAELPAGGTDVLRLFRLLRLTRMARMLRSITELMILIKGMAAAARSVFFVMCLLVIIIYVFSIAFTQLAAGTVMGSFYFPTVQHSMYTLLIYGTFLDDIAPFCDEVGAESVACLVLVFVFAILAACTVLNMLIGILCEVVSAVATTEKEDMMVHMVTVKLERLLQNGDTNNDGNISQAPLALGTSEVPLYRERICFRALDKVIQHELRVAIAFIFRFLQGPVAAVSPFFFRRCYKVNVPCHGACRELASASASRFSGRQRLGGPILAPKLQRTVVSAQARAFSVTLIMPAPFFAGSWVKLVASSSLLLLFWNNWNKSLTIQNRQNGPNADQSFGPTRPRFGERELLTRRCWVVQCEPMDRFGDLRLASYRFDPTQEPLRSQLINQLGAGPSALIEVAKNFVGGVNAGLWLLRAQEEMVLKLVRFDATAPSQLVEASMFAKLAKEFPKIAEDPALAFPTKIFHVRTPNGVRSHDLVVMRRAPGRLLADLISERCRAGRAEELLDILERVGICTAEFHHRYRGKQHCDLGPHNICFDEESGRTTLIDLGGMGNTVSSKDVDRFCQILRRMADGLGQELQEGVRRFQEGYVGTAQRLSAALGDLEQNDGVRPGHGPPSWILQQSETHPCGCLPQWYLGCTGLGKKPPQHGSSACPDTATDD